MRSVARHTVQLSTSSHTNTFLEQYGYSMNEVSESEVYSPDGQKQESIHLISVKKTASYPL